MSVAGRASCGGAFALASARRAAMASSSLRRCPTIPTPRSFRSSAVKFGRTVSSIAFSRNAASYCPRPRLRSQSPRSMVAPHLPSAHMILQAKQRVQGTFSNDRCGSNLCRTQDFYGTAALPPETGIARRSWHGRKVAIANIYSLFDHLVGAGEQRRRNCRGRAPWRSCRLMTNSNLADCSTGKSFSPLRTRPT